MRYSDGTIFEFIKKDKTYAIGMCSHNTFYMGSFFNGIERRPVETMYSGLEKDVKIFAHELKTPLTGEQRENLKVFLNCHVGKKCGWLEVIAPLTNKLFKREDKTMEEYYTEFIFRAYWTIGLLSKRASMTFTPRDLISMIEFNKTTKDRIHVWR